MERNSQEFRSRSAIHESLGDLPLSTVTVHPPIPPPKNRMSLHGSSLSQTNGIKVPPPAHFAYEICPGPCAWVARVGHRKTLDHRVQPATSDPGCTFGPPSTRNRKRSGNWSSSGFSNRSNRPSIKPSRCTGCGNRIQSDGDGHMRGIGCFVDAGWKLFPGDPFKRQVTRPGRVVRKASAKSIQFLKRNCRPSENSPRFGLARFGVMVPRTGDTWTRMFPTAARTNRSHRSTTR